MTNKIIAIHQPNYFPWLGYFLKMASCDEFVFLDHVQFSSDSYTKRVKIASNQTEQGWQWLSIPIVKAPVNSAISDIEIYKKSWTEEHLARIVQSYRKHRFYQECRLVIFDLIFQGNEFSSLSKYNIFVIGELAKLFDISTTLINSTELKQSTDKGDSGLIDIINQLEGSIYISGLGGHNYQSEKLFAKNKIELIYNDPMSLLDLHPYKQRISTNGYGVSIIDMWMNLGLDGIKSFIAEHGKL
jgi:hypothetical protein